MPRDNVDDQMERGEARCFGHEKLHDGDEKDDFEPPQPSPSSTAVGKESDYETDQKGSPTGVLARCTASWGRFFSRNESGDREEEEEVEDANPIKVRKCKTGPARKKKSKQRTKICSYRAVADCPDGYPKLAAYLDSDENFMLYRRFGFLQSRLLLNKQDQLRVLEERLDEIDRTDEETYLVSREMDDAHERPRTRLMKEIEVKFKEYAELLALAQQLAAMNKPASRDYNSVRTYFENKAPVCEDEQYINCKEDIITLKPGRENAWLDAVVEKGLQKLACPTVRFLFCSAETRAKADENTILYAKERIDALVTLIITAMILALMIIPIYALWHLSNEVQNGTTTAVTIGVLLVFTLIFSAVLSLFTRARRHEILGAAAAYCAVLVVFIGNVGGNGSGTGSAISY